jgi:hypothetical protein
MNREKKANREDCRIQGWRTGYHGILSTSRASWLKPAQPLDCSAMDHSLFSWVFGGADCTRNQKLLTNIEATQSSVQEESGLLLTFKP